MWHSGMYVWPSWMSCSTAWRWLNVPRPQSCPVRRTRVPSVTSEANANSSAMPQLSGFSPLAMAVRSAISFSIWRCG